MSALKGSGLLLVVVLVSSCNFSPDGMLGGDPTYPQNYTAVGASDVQKCDEFDSYAEEKSPGCETPSDAQVTLGKSQEDGKVLVTLAPDSLGAIPVVKGLWYRVYDDGSSIDNDGKGHDVGLECSQPVAAGAGHAVTCSFPAAYASEATHVPQEGTTLARFYMIQVKHPVCDNSRYLQIMREACGGGAPVPQNVAAPRIYLTLTGAPPSP